MEEIKVRKRLQNSARNAALRPCTLYSEAGRSKGSATHRDGWGDPHCKGPLNQIFIQTNEKGHFTWRNGQTQ